jgi:diadenosine tetraphosphate (Ap4A) HIT family hydrolase
MKQVCPFCVPDGIILSNDLAFALYDKYPVNKGHMLIIPRRHVEDFWASTSEERKALNDLIVDCKKHLDKNFKPDGYNIGINCGEAAGQTVFHLHIHLIPRYLGDIENPRGGVRGVIPARRRLPIS